MLYSRIGMMALTNRYNTNQAHQLESQTIAMQVCIDHVTATRQMLQTFVFVDLSVADA